LDILSLLRAITAVKMLHLHDTKKRDMGSAVAFRRVLARYEHWCLNYITTSDALIAGGTTGFYMKQPDYVW